MYPVTNEFKLAAKQPVQEHRLYGTIGSASFDESNIIEGSFHITNQCTESGDVVLGSVFTGTLTATFTGLSIPRYAWIGKRITVYFGLKTTPTTWEDIPMGIFTVKEAKHSAEGVSVTAYDDMIKLDKKFKKSKFKEPAKIYNFLTTICNTCGLILEDSEQTIQSRPNGNTLLGIVGTASNSKLKKYANDIETYRDLVFWIAQSMACFATINKLGHLMFVPYKNENNVVDEITETHRIAGAVFDDFTTNYTGIYVTNTADGEEIYYGYDEATLEAEVATVEGDIHDVEIALDQLAYQYQQGQITEAEYKRQKKVLDKQLKNLTKRLAWLNEALDKARLEEDGLYMDLGENPMMQADGVGNTPTTMRRRILNALDAISYTPFTCNTVCGAHYDLGDIIRFTGGHATELGEVCCVMAYDFTMNGEYQMQGFGSDPSKGVMKSKNSKKADKANRNADSSAKNITGNTTPTSGNDGDLHIQYEGEHEAEITCGGGFRIDSITGDYKSGYNIDITFSNDMSMEALYLKYTGLTANTEYTFACQMQIDTNSLAYYNNQSGFSICVSDQKLWNTDGMGIPYGQAHGGEITEVENPRAVAQSMYYDTNWHDYRINFKPVGEECYVIFTYTYLQSTFGGRHVETHVKDMIFTGADLPTIDKVNIEGEWKNIDYVKKVKQVQTSSGGTKIATAQNSDGSTTDIYAPTIPVEDVKVDGTSVVTSKVANINTMTGATASAAGSNGLVPAPASGDEGKFLRGDGTWQNAGGGGNDVGLSVGSNGAIQSTYTDGTEQTEDILRDDTGNQIATVLDSIADTLNLLNQPEVYAPIVYSTEEREVGVWTNGKPLYQKTFNTGALTQGTVKTFSIADLNMETCVKCSGFGIDPINGWIISINDVTPGNLNGSFRTYVNVVNKNLYIEPGTGTGNGYTQSFITVQYTKTTDIAGSGHYAALGVPAVHYSTSEQVIGTWIDGKPIYQKTLYHAGSVSGTISIAHGISNLSKVLNYSGMVSDESGIPFPLPRIAYDNNNVGVQSVDTTYVSMNNPSAFGTRLNNWYVTIQYTKTTD